MKVPESFWEKMVISEGISRYLSKVVLITKGPSPAGTASEIQAGHCTVFTSHHLTHEEIPRSPQKLLTGTNEVYHILEPEVTQSSLLKGTVFSLVPAPARGPGGRSWLVSSLLRHPHHKMSIHEDTRFLYTSASAQEFSGILNCFRNFRRWNSTRTKTLSSFLTLEVLYWSNHLTPVIVFIY